jgi:hypothetical protein
MGLAEQVQRIVRAMQAKECPRLKQGDVLAFLGRAMRNEVGKIQAPLKVPGDPRVHRVRKRRPVPRDPPIRLGCHLVMVTRTLLGS